MRKKITIICISCITFLLLVFAIPILINESYKFNNGYVTIWDAPDVLSFYGVILSGVITIGGLVVTINYSKKETEKQIRFARSQTNVPFFVIQKVSIDTDDSDSEFQYSPCDSAWEKSLIISKYNRDNEKVAIKLKNMGEGIAIIQNCNVDLLSNDNIVIPTCVCRDACFNLIYNIKTVLENKFGNDVSSKTFQPFSAHIILCYKNTLGVTFEQKITLYHDWDRNNNMIHLIIKGISTQSVWV